MSGFFRAVGAVASIAAVIPGPHQPIAAAVAVVSGTLAQVTASKPTQGGTVQGFLVGENQPMPYLIGEAYTEGVELYKTGYGGEVDDVQNPYAFIPRVYSCCGPIESMGATLVNYSGVSFSGAIGSVQEAQGYYAEHLFIDQQTGARPEAGALQSPAGWGTPTRWSGAHKLSGFAAVGWSLMWSKDAEQFAGGQIPPLGKVPRGVRVYDRRLDSTAPGGSGPQRLDDESTWAYSTNPANHAATYAYGRIMNGKPIFGVRLFDESAIDWNAIIAWANVCDANGWTVNGTIYEPGDKWNNLKLICEAGGAQPVPGSVLSFDYQAPRTSLYTVTKDDLAGPINSKLGRGWKNRHNVLVPRYREPAQQWGYPQAEEVRNEAWIAQDGEEKVDERQWKLVTNVDQVTELATYDLWQRREAGSITLPCKSHMRLYRPGHCLTLDEELGAHPDGEIKVVIRRRSIDITTGVVTFICEMETDAKHTAALGLQGGAPTAVVWPSQQEIDATLAMNRISRPELRSLFTGRIITTVDPADNLFAATENQITIAAFNCDFGDKAVSYPGATLTTEDDGTTAITDGTRYHFYIDDAARSGGKLLKATRNIQLAINSSGNPGRIYVGSFTTDVVGGTGSSGGGSPPPGVSGDDFYGTN